MQITRKDLIGSKNLLGIKNSENRINNSLFPANEDTNGSNQSPVKDNYFIKTALMIFIASCVVIMFSSIITKNRQDRLTMLYEKNKLEKQIEMFETENSQLEREYLALKNDPTTIEREAREQLGYIASGETIYQKYNFKIKSVVKQEPLEETPQNRWKTFLFEGPFPWQFPTLIILFASAYFLISYYYEYRKLHRSNC